MLDVLIGELYGYARNATVNGILLRVLEAMRQYMLRASIGVVVPENIRDHIVDYLQLTTLA